jgi:putative spermidine/putrescine transport system permease protein
VLAAIPVAFKLHNHFHGKKLLTTLVVLPITLGTVLTVQGLLIFAGRQSWLNRFLIQIRLLHQPVVFVNNYWGVVFSLIISGFSSAFLIISSHLSGIDPSIEAATKAMGANWAAALPPGDPAPPGPRAYDDLHPDVRTRLQRLPVGPSRR